MTRALAIDELGKLIADRKADCAIVSLGGIDALVYARNVLILQESTERAEMEKRNDD